MDVWEVDALQRELYQRARLDPDVPANMLDLACGLGLRVRMIHPATFPGDGMLVGDEVLLRTKISRVRKRFALAHEIAEWRLAGVAHEYIEQLCDALAAALIAPRRPFIRAANELGAEAFGQLAFAFGMTQTGAALRSAETLLFPLALVRPGLVRVRGPLEFEWGTEAQVRRWAEAPRPGLKKVEITDEPRRAALVADEQLGFGAVLDADGTSGW